MTEICMFETEQTKRLREMIQQASDIQQAATALVNDLTDQLQRSIFLHDTSNDAPAPRARRKAARRSR